MGQRWNAKYKVLRYISEVYATKSKCPTPRTVALAPVRMPHTPCTEAILAYFQASSHTLQTQCQYWHKWTHTPRTVEVAASWAGSKHSTHSGTSTYKTPTHATLHAQWPKSLSARAHIGRQFQHTPRTMAQALLLLNAFYCCLESACQCWLLLSKLATSDNTAVSPCVQITPPS